MAWIRSARKPLSTIHPGELFTTAAHRKGDAAPKTAFHGRAAPLPTNAWWENVAMAAPLTPAGNIFQMPYVVMADTRSVRAMQPFMVGAAAETFDNGLALSMGALEGLEGPFADAWDELSCSLGWHGAGDTQMVVPLVRGSPYITTEYSGITPRISSEQTLRSPVITVDGKSADCDGVTSLAGYVFALDFVESDATWLFFSSQGVRWVCQASPFLLTAKAPLYGAVRAALANNCTTGSGQRHCEGAPAGRDMLAYATLLLQHAGAYPVNSSVDFDVVGDVGTVNWRWGSKNLAGWRHAPLLQLAWPVHFPLLSRDARQAAAVNPATPFHDIRGPATAMTGDTWRMSYELIPDVGLRAPRPIAESLRPELLDALRGKGGASWNGTMSDSDFDLPLNYQVGVGDTYFSGKMLARLARLVTIADELGESGEKYFQEMVDRLTERLEVWLKPDSETPFVYDASWGGMLSCGCIYDDCHGHCKPHCANKVKPAEECPALANSGMNFGNAFYNDHHFHYGYFIYAAAVLAKHNPSWERTWRQQILAIVRDYGNPSTADPSFPLARHKDWFLGFSWAGGIEAMANGRNQGSTSEAINSYYALYVYGATVDAPFAQELKDFGRLLTAMEVHGADTYWHVHRDSSIYGDAFHHQVIGILWEHAATYESWFGAASYIVSGVQLLPFTPATEASLQPRWVSEHFPDYKADCDADPECDKGWSWPVCLEQAVLDPEAARRCLRRLPGDSFSTAIAAANGNSLTNSLHWVATRPSAAFAAPSVLPATHKPHAAIVTRPAPAASGPSASELDFPAWAVVAPYGLNVRSEKLTTASILDVKAHGVVVHGRQEGNWVNLLDEPGYMMIRSGADLFLKEDPKECSAHAACSALGLTGTCCPARDGRMLECCGTESQKAGSGVYFLRKFRAPTAAPGIGTVEARASDVVEGSMLATPPVLVAGAMALTTAAVAGLVALTAALVRLNSLRRGCGCHRGMVAVSRDRDPGSNAAAASYERLSPQRPPSAATEGLS